MISPRRLTPNDHMLIAVRVNALIGEAGRQAFVWQMHKQQKQEYIPPLFRGGGELPVVPRIAPVRIDSPFKFRDARR